MATSAVTAMTTPRAINIHAWLPFGVRAKRSGLEFGISGLGFGGTANERSKRNHLAEAQHVVGCVLGACLRG
jgi:hypothetical protein